MNPDPLKSIVAGLGEPAPPPGFEQAVMARIAQVAEARPRPTARPVPTPTRPPAPTWYDLPAWAASVAGIVVFFASWIAGHLAPGGLAALMSSPQAAMAALVNMPTNLPALVGLTAGAVLYITGLFAQSDGPTSSRVS